MYDTNYVLYNIVCIYMVTSLNVAERSEATGSTELRSEGEGW